MSALNLIDSLINKVNAVINSNVVEEKKQDNRLGGAKDVDKNDKMLLAAAEAVKQQVIDKAAFAQIKEYEVVAAKCQVVAGLNYCIKIKTDKDIYTHVCVYARLDRTYELQGISFNKTLNDAIDFSCKNQSDAKAISNVEEEKKEESKQQDNRLGGAKDVDKNDDMLLAAAEAVKQQVIDKAAFAQIKEYEVVAAKCQVVAGINYCIKIKTDKNIYTHVCVYAKLDRTYELQGISFNKTLNDAIDFSCKNQSDPKAIANSFVGKIFYKDSDSGNDPNGVYKNDVNAIATTYRAVYPPAAMTMDYNATRLNIFMEKETNKIIKVTWG